MKKFAIPKNMNTEIWSSSQMGGTGGALKALTKNLANQLNLNRTEMKRVVARVISERHGQGDVGDYNGHMFYVKPERIDLTDQITHSKEAFDEMLNHKRIQRSGSRNQMPTTRSSLRSRSLTHNMTMRQNKPDKCLTGVIIDQHQMPKPGNHHEIAVQMSKPKIKSTRSKQQIKRKPQTQNSQCHNSQPSRQHNASKTLIKPKSISKLTIQSKPQLVTTKKKVLVKSEVKNLMRKPLAIKRPQRCQSTASKVQRLNAGKVIQQETPKPKPQTEYAPQLQHQPVVLSEPAVSNVEYADRRKIVMKQNKSIKLLPNAKGKLNSRKTYDQPWQEPKRMIKKRLGAGGLMTKPNRMMNPSHIRNKGRTWRNPYQFPGAAGATQRINAYQCSKSKYGVNIKPRINNNKLPINRNFRQSNVGRLKNKRSQARLARQLEREEAIDDPERLEAGSMLNYSVRRCLSIHSKRGKRIYKLSARLEELAKPVFHGKSSPDKLSVRSRSRSHSPTRKPKMKLRPRRRRRRVLVDSSLGSIAGLKGSSRSGLTPAKRHLTLAFMNKDSSRSPRRSRSVMWR